MYRALEGGDTIAGAIVDALRGQGDYDSSGDTEIDVQITVFRFRSTANTVWNGLFAGIDRLEGDVAVQSPTAARADYHFTLSGEEDLYFKYSSRARLRSLAHVLGMKVAGLFDHGV